MKDDVGGVGLKALWHGASSAGIDASSVPYRHGDLDMLETLLRSSDGTRTLVVVDAGFSMDGDIADLPSISRLCRQYGALLMVDEAHRLGVLGETGRGITEHFDLPSGSVDVHMGTLSKIIPSAGGYIAGSRELVDAIKYNARGGIFSAALPPPQAAAAGAALDVMAAEPGRVATLRALTGQYRQGLTAEGFSFPDAVTPIVPLACPNEAMTLAFARQARNEGVLAYPIVHPAVPIDQPRVRTTVTAAQTPRDVEVAIAALARAARHTGVLPTPSHAS